LAQIRTFVPEGQRNWFPEAAFDGVLRPASLDRPRLRCGAGDAAACRFANWRGHRGWGGGSDPWCRRNRPHDQRIGQIAWTRPL